MTALNQVKDLMKNYCFQHSDAQPDRQPKSAIRLRTSGPVDPNRPRPIKVEFTSEASKWKFIKRANASLRSLNVFVKPDESQNTHLKCTMRLTLAAFSTLCRKSNINSQMKFFTGKREAVNKYVPKKTRRSPNDAEPMWFNQDS
ncbi:hypothetical protein EB796_020382 [Bugula neritina]|uniref:Uncharacterized protein n=1 Tax=Bugula neritina TaxID=10212 RepID=A0A7J7J7A1_BUGNE|nr:hypothetical protein EB796_020382 [Bugula neritina]